jgi:RHH-type proline utilization regulon transcriptional repressor/proline dehydrogenase/delta 1-pyrroline-5-carboxylate dehydrogenase
MATQGRVRKTLAVPAAGLFVAPTVIELDGIEQLEEEIFGPVLHVARFAASEIDAVVDTINAQGYGLTFGIHTRVDSRVEQIVRRIRAGNVYVNRNQIGAVVGTQPFGGEGLSGTGPKAGGPWYLHRFCTKPALQYSSDNSNPDQSITATTVQGLISGIVSPTAGHDQVDLDTLKHLAHEAGLDLAFNSVIDVHTLPGPTGETNQLSAHPRGVVLCLGPGRDTALAQALSALAQQNTVVIVAEQGADLGHQLQQANLPATGIDGGIEADTLREVQAIDAVMSQAQNELLIAFRIALSEREGKLIPLICEIDSADRLIVERHLCIDTTAAGGNASLIAAGS